ncbi:MAG: hypothetical protein A2096_04250 [Spirochaetes bacterium GWF1_41_5]|nr:MAG: hypothetical protein A2096_04250 [Spirochaetes bacterium GWF1_41_5]HBE04632.1 hypothetical protein [Spirochaetia bacterium]
MKKNICPITLLRILVMGFLLNFVFYGRDVFSAHIIAVWNFEDQSAAEAGKAAGWSAGDSKIILAYSSLDPAQGQFCASLAYNGGPYISWVRSSAIAIKAGEKIKISFKYRNPQAVLFTARIDFLNNTAVNNKNNVKPIADTMRCEKQKYVFIIRNDENCKENWFEQNSAIITTPEDASFFTLNFGAGKNKSGTVYIDSIEIQSIIDKENAQAGKSPPKIQQSEPDEENIIYALKSDSEINIDGNLETLIWQKTTPVKAFQKYQIGDAADEETEVRILFDNAALYLGFKCFDPILNRIIAEEKTRDDTSICRNDSVEMLFSPYPQSDIFYHFIVNFKGSLYDAENRNANWNCRNIKIASSGGSDFWTAVVAIPFSSLGPDIKIPDIGTQWRIKFLRTKMLPQKNLSMYPFSLDAFPSLAGCADLVFDSARDNDGRKFSANIDNTQNWGCNNLTVFFPAAGNKPRVYTGELILSDVLNNELYKAEKKFSLPAGLQSLSREILYEIKNGNEYFLKLRIIDVQNASAAWTKLFKLEFNRPEFSVSECKSKLETLAKSADELPVNDFSKKLKKKIIEEISILDSCVNLLDKTIQSGKAVSQEESCKILQDLDSCCKFLSLSSEYVWMSAPYALHAPDDIPHDNIQINEINLEMAQNEYKSLCLKFLNINNDQEIRIRCPHLKDENNNFFLSKRIQIREVKFLKTVSGKITGDVLCGNDANIFSLKRGVTAPLFCTFNSEKAVPGCYEGSLIVKPILLSTDRQLNEKNTRIIKIRLTIHPITLAPPLPLAISLYSGSGGKSQSFENNVLLHDLLSHRINSMPLLFNEIIGGIENSISNVLQKEMFRTGVLQYRMSAFISPDTAADFGIPPESCFFYLWDEPKKIDENMLLKAEDFKKRNPRIKLIQNLGSVFPGKEEIIKLNKYIDIWMPHFSYFFPMNEKNDDNLKFFKSLGKPLWTYQCPSEPMICDAYRDYKLYPWIIWKLGLGGLNWWAYASWQGDSWDLFDKGKNPLSMVSDAGMVYEGRYQGDIVSSIRWEAFREGLCDWFLLYSLKNLVLKSSDVKIRKQTEEILNRAVDDVIGNNTNQLLSDKWRTNIMRIIINFK